MCFNHSGFGGAALRSRDTESAAAQWFYLKVDCSTTELRGHWRSQARSMRDRADLSKCEYNRLVKSFQRWYLLGEDHCWNQAGARFPPAT